MLLQQRAGDCHLPFVYYKLLRRFLMKKVFSIVLSILLVISIAGVAVAKEKVKVKQITGEVAAVDAAAKSLTVKGKKAEVVISTDEKTMVKAEKEKKSLSDVQVGDKVTVKYSEVDGKNIAKSIEIKPSKTEKKSTEPAKPAKK
jgi:Cu/Ag efflux protein CusF